MVRPAAPPEPAFFDGVRGRLMTVRWPAAGEERGAVLVVPPFAEEMNKSRRMMALQARDLSRRGFHVLLPDLYGCGDSEGDLAGADWDLWLEDLAALTGTLGPGPLFLLAVRLGSLLAADLEARLPRAVRGQVWWQPVARGRQFLTRFLRLQLAADLVRAGEGRTTTGELRQRLEAGATVEVAGYPLGPAIAGAIDARELGQTAASLRAAVLWVDVLADEERPVPALSRQTVEALRGAGVDLEYRKMVGEGFWGTPEIAEVPSLIGYTGAWVEERV